jgi:putative transposase
VNENSKTDSKKSEVDTKSHGKRAFRGGYWSGAHTLHRLRYHIVFVPKYRKRVLKDDLSVRLKELIVSCCSVNSWGLEELNIQEDHFHMLLQLPANISVSSAVKLLKGGSSKILREEFPSLEEFLWGTSFWGVGYFCESVGIMDEEMIRRYIRNQDKNHAKSSPSLS